MSGSVENSLREILIGQHSVEGWLGEKLNLVLVSEPIEVSYGELGSCKRPVKPDAMQLSKDIGLEHAGGLSASLCVAKRRELSWIGVELSGLHCPDLGLRCLEPLELEHDLVLQSSPPMLVESSRLSQNQTLKVMLQG